MWLNLCHVLIIGHIGRHTPAVQSLCQALSLIYIQFPTAAYIAPHLPHLLYSVSLSFCFHVFLLLCHTLSLLYIIHPLLPFPLPILLVLGVPARCFWAWRVALSLVQMLIAIHAFPLLLS